LEELMAALEETREELLLTKERLSSTQHTLSLRDDMRQDRRTQLEDVLEMKLLVLQKELSGYRVLQKELSGYRVLQKELSGYRVLQKELSGYWCYSRSCQVTGVTAGAVR
ncbi:hypothetical protein NHX12_013163, partial [Muraenolepis orangiensis]